MQHNTMELLIYNSYTTHSLTTVLSQRASATVLRVGSLHLRGIWLNHLLSRSVYIAADRLLLLPSSMTLSISCSTWGPPLLASMHVAAAFPMKCRTTVANRVPHDNKWGKWILHACWAQALFFNPYISSLVLIHSISTVVFAVLLFTFAHIYW